MNPLSFYHFAAGCGAKIFGTGLYDGITCSNGGPTFNDLMDIWKIVGNLTQIALKLSGALALVFLIVGGVFYVTSAGEPDKIRRAKDIITNSVLGLVLSLLALAIVLFIAKGF